MNWNAIGSIGEIIGGMAVVITLLYLAGQVRHARREQQIAAVRANRNERRDYLTALRDSPYLPGILCKVRAGEELSPEEEARLMFHLATAWSLSYSEWGQAQLELAGEFQTSSEYGIATTLAQHGSVEWFREHGERLYPKAFVAHVRRIREGLETSSSDMHA